MFQIVRVSPVHCQITDAMIGSTKRRLPMTYLTIGCARAISGRLTGIEYEGCGDDYFYVTEAGDKSFSMAMTEEDKAKRQAWLALNDDFPF